MKELAIIILSFFCFFFSTQASAQQDSVAVQRIITPIPPDAPAGYKNPEFPGGHPAFVKKILNNFPTSLLAKLNIARAKAVATFIVEPDGSMTNLKIESSEHEAVKNEFLKALKMVQTKWTPGEQDGTKVRMKMKQPLVFITE